MDGLPLAHAAVPGLARYEDLVFEGWDLNGQSLAAACAEHRVLNDSQLAETAEALGAVRPRPGVASEAFCRRISGSNIRSVPGHRAAVAAIVDDLRDMRVAHGLDGIVMVNLASTERTPDAESAALRSMDAFERGLDADDPAIGPAMLYARAAIEAGVPYGNFTPSVAADAPALVELSRRRGVPVAGKDGKTGQTMMKTVIAPALRARALHVDGWFSTNILGNRDGEALRDRDSLASKLGTKGSVLDSILGYPVEDHIVDIRYYRPRGDDKEAWDNIDVTGFLGHRMQIKVNFLCKDSVLAAPLVLEIARLLDLAAQRGEGGPQEQLSIFFKAPMTVNGHAPEHAFHAQERMLTEWLGAGAAE
ncbi:inositol-3-phosphate synthase [Roseicella aquatilis]|uniref:inositol-3-phosphate synthase n=1 Tax=Roseicella aquatilis TaxID=2527868 RepID=UPI001981F788|nr:inositol-3-phosphate synthase [Roseicella aquatilis]